MGPNPPPPAVTRRGREHPVDCDGARRRADTQWVLGEAISAEATPVTPPNPGKPESQSPAPPPPPRPGPPHLSRPLADWPPGWMCVSSACSQAVLVPFLEHPFSRSTRPGMKLRSSLCAVTAAATSALALIRLAHVGKTKQICRFPRAPAQHGGKQPAWRGAWGAPWPSAMPQLSSS